MSGHEIDGLGRMFLILCAWLLLHGLVDSRRVIAIMAFCSAVVCALLAAAGRVPW